MNDRSFLEDDRLERERLAQLGQGDVVEDDADADLGGEDEDPDLLEMDPKRWKVRPSPEKVPVEANNVLNRRAIQQEQDHYAVLGLQHLRYHANQEQIKKAREYLPPSDCPFLRAGSGRVCDLITVP